MVRGARQDAPNEGNKQQQVDRGEPGGREGVKELQGVENFEELGILSAELNDSVGVTGALRDKRAGDGGERQQQ